jgi:putative SOS response-associated peptidase YedK
MCGRYTLTQVGPRLVGERFELGEAEIEPATLGRFNVCPTETILTVDGEGPRAVRWGLVPSYAKKLNQGPMLINARVETVATKSPFAKLLARPERRCLVPADGWYEWLKPETPKGDKIPFRYTVDGGGPFSFAGLWGWANIDEEWIASATILTTTANGVCRPVHDRMPCVLVGAEAEAAWLSADVDVPAALDLLTPLEDARCAAAPANPAVNKAGVEGPELLVVPDGGPEPDQLTLV